MTQKDVTKNITKHYQRIIGGDMENFKTNHINQYKHILSVNTTVK